MISASVSFVMCNFNGESIFPIIERSVHACLSQTFAPERVVIVDDSSTDASPELLRKLEKSDRRIKVVSTVARSGVAVAKNLGIAECSSGLMAFMDNDAVPAKDWAEKMAGRMLSSQEIGACASRVMYMDKPDILNSLGTTVDFIGHGHGIGDNLMYEFAALPEEVLSPVGTAMMVRSDVLKKTAGYDEEFFYGYDDTDLAVRIRDMGYRIPAEPGAVAHHIGSFSSALTDSSYYNKRNRLRFVMKHFRRQDVRRFLGREIPYALFHTHQKSKYLRALVSAASGSDVSGAGEQSARLDGFLRRYGALVGIECGLGEYPDNRAFSAPFEPMSFITVGRNENRFIYHGWHPPEKTGGMPFRWAAKVSSIRFSLDVAARGLEMECVRNQDIKAQELTVIARDESGEKRARVQVRGSRKMTVELPLNPGKCTVIFVADKKHLERGYRPRELAWGLKAIRRLEN
jgi:GT2 family glycosyltransferase